MEISQITTQLYSILPVELHSDIPALAKILENLFNGQVNPTLTQDALSSIPNIKSITDRLIGKNLDYHGAVVSFGQNNQFGDVRIGDIAGRDIYKFNIALVSQQEASQFSLLIAMTSDILTKDITQQQTSYWPVAVLGGLSIASGQIPFVPSWIPVTGVLSALASWWLLLKGHKKVGRAIWWASLTMIILISVLYLLLLARIS